MHKFFYSITICMLHYNPRHVSSFNMPIFRRTNCIITASGIVTLCKGMYSMPDESRLQSALIRHRLLKIKCVCLYVCMFVCVCLCVCMCVYIYIYMCVCVCVCVCVCIIYIYIYIYIYICVCVCVCV